MTDGNRSYWDKHAKNYDRSMSLLGRPIPRMVELAGEATRGFRGCRVPLVVADLEQCRAPGCKHRRQPVGERLQSVERAIAADYYNAGSCWLGPDVCLCLRDIGGDFQPGIGCVGL